MAESKRRMAAPQLGTPTGMTSTTRSRWHTLPPELLNQACKRVRIMIVSVGSLWVIALLMDTVVAPLLGHMHMEGMIMMDRFPGNVIGWTGIATSVGALFLTRHFTGRPHALINIGLGYQVLTAALVSLLTNLEPNFGIGRISWACLIILIQPAVVPTAPIKTLIASLIIATMDPVVVWIAHLRGAVLPEDAYLLAWAFLPNYISVGLAMLPSAIIMGLSRQVNEARELGSYLLGELIGRGGMGEVYHARHRMLARPAAIKLIRPESLGAADMNVAQGMIQRFRREAQAAASLRSPHTIVLYDFGVTDDGTFYYVMELLDGFDLETLVKRFGPVSPARAIHLLNHVCQSLAEAHARGLIHRDVKPSNIFTCRLGLRVDYAKVLDFGLVKVARDSEVGAGTVLMTNPDVTTGTPAFMSPEMALGDAVDHRADIYALGCVGYWLLTGRLVFEADTPVKMMLQHIQSTPKRPSELSELEIPPELEQALLRCLAKKPEDRPQSAEELRELLTQVPLPERWTKERAAVWWDVHRPADAPVTKLHEETPVATMHVVK
jgi:serine/threonine-protein kinase